MNLKSFKIVETGSYLPSNFIKNCELEKRLQLESGYIAKRTGIQQRFIAKEQKIETLAIKSVENLVQKLEKEKQNLQNIGLIVVATTSTNQLMPGISNRIQEKWEIPNCICMDILAGCSGFINAFDIAALYLQTGKVERALVIGTEVLTQYTDKEDASTAILLGDGAGAVLLEKTNQNKKYHSHIFVDGSNASILTCQTNQKIKMNGKEIYKYAVTETVKNVKELLEQKEEILEEISYIVPHQSNFKIIKAIATRLDISFQKMYLNLEKVGNTFCASIPIAINEMKEKGLLQEGEKIILLGYGGGLNTGSILMEI